jgi:lipoprotein-anchoring transpeptidase ErfK/SrfK
MFALTASRLSLVQNAIRFCVLVLPMALTACIPSAPPPQQAARYIDPAYIAMYGPRPDEEHPLPATDLTEVDPRFLRREVAYYGREEPGTVVIDTAARYLYLVRDGGRAIRYGIGVGRDGFQWQGLVQITNKKEWPDWTPPPEMIQRQPYLPRFMAGGPGNPLGARAMYLGNTVYRIHGTNRPDTIGTKVSSGCFRLVNNDVADLYDRVPVGTKVVIRQKPEL